MLVGVLTVPILEKRPRPQDSASPVEGDQNPDHGDAVLAAAPSDPEPVPPVAAVDGLLVQEAQH